ncbi:hypothetical protein B9Z55_019276 [Caenorhabditis nigoni]|uniref:Uncharacterized protein n=1 Tax=Caenorhabditis nigoni TaxID=1611254 RepID=A0A2G5THN4_9PELO|nr:hypothetical protein B9Z55_019276 [Caenorhabditis nigoni]
MSVRDKYRSTFNELQRAESIPERISVFRKAWAWMIEASQNAMAHYGFVVISLYIIGLSLWSLDSCDDIPPYLLMIGMGLFVCSLYQPFYSYGKKKAAEDRQDRIVNHLEPLHDGEIGTEEVNKFIPCRMNRVCNYAFTFVCGIAPIFTYYTFYNFSSRGECHTITYWTAFVLAFIYSCWVFVILSACCLCCCYFTIPELMQKSQNNREQDVETGND